MSLSTLHGFVGLSPSSPHIQEFIAQLASTPLDPETKAYADVMYVNYHDLGISFCCVPLDGGKVDKAAGWDGVQVESIDLYNPRITAAQGRSRRRAWSVFRGLPLAVPTSGQAMLLEVGTRGRDIVEALGEPSRKGGGTGWVDVWLEYASVGVLFDLQDPRGEEIVSQEEQARGIGGVWDRAGRWVWSSIKVFKPGAGDSSAHK
ncbi:hypothetical protein NliqN6_1631 [Naganishia liquefaciens]|uniref:Uncharacterized protein n=1 Tax=Naganishia liquefaciens TaxID=104408 RepID=A0A8H3TQR1_9TREE|nr:hypothetical protein NliqN6_1631 [Naganishia liquefaciens]